MFGEGELARPNCDYHYYIGIVVIIDNVGIDGSGGYFGHSVLFVENSKILTDFGPVGHFLGVGLVESIDKRLIFGLSNSTIR